MQRNAQRVRTAMLILSGLTQKAGLKKPNLSLLENSKHQPSLETLEHISGALSVTVAETFANF
jgi:transcriptional regulator with XRE-family HTH domain